ncbi:MbnP family protein [Aequorivita echinoideorum]|uniref:Copper-binding protein MbnP-like domain-containing protein n=1 Tax=Aequorivita echinoideorum TaxID=1549647 RepID=A0ABS5S3J1_9FLAO|nr:MbnP family protein [Aequorivita echinoideorum]MBT0606957.1 hypothetical protein [Aequorivita echinoideorum]
MKKIGLLVMFAVFAIGCNSDDDSSAEILGCMDPDSINFNPEANTDDGSCSYLKNVTFNFTQNWGGEDRPVTKIDFNSTTYENEMGTTLTLSKLRYLISKIQLHKSDTTITIENYQLVDLAMDSSLSLAPTQQIPTGDYTGISFVYGFNEEDNISGNYPDLNDASWNWPAMLGGGYHFMQMEGSYNDENGMPQPYAYHNGRARLSMDNFVNNHLEFDFQRNFTVTDDTTIEIRMDISEWYKNPNMWDLNQYNVDLMMNYDAQILMHENGASVFSIGEINQ